RLGTREQTLEGSFPIRSLQSPVSSPRSLTAMWRALRIAILLFILATVAQGAWLARSRTADWGNTLRVVVYPINGDASRVSAEYVSQLNDASYQPIAAFFREEGKRHGVRVAQPVSVAVAPPLGASPPAPPFGGSRVEVILWSLRLRYWAYRNDTYKGPKADVRLFVSYFDPAARQR